MTVRRPRIDRLTRQAEVPRSASDPTTGTETMTSVIFVVSSFLFSGLFFFLVLY